MTYDDRYDELDTRDETLRRVQAEEKERLFGFRYSDPEALGKTHIIATSTDPEMIERLTEMFGLPTSVEAQNSRGEWVPSIPLPLYDNTRPWARHRCDCGRRFSTAAAYRGHYALVHILGLS